ncbi:MAG: hypothetical protein ABSB88_26615, partial [Bryobacteraceae bacterium]
MISPVRIAGPILLLVAALTGQHAAPKFDVVSIRPVPENAPLILKDSNFTPVLPGGQFDDPRSTLGPYRKCPADRSRAERAKLGPGTSDKGVRSKPLARRRAPS